MYRITKSIHVPNEESNTPPQPGSLWCRDGGNGGIVMLVYLEPTEEWLLVPIHEWGSNGTESKEHIIGRCRKAQQPDLNRLLTNWEPYYGTLKLTTIEKEFDHNA